MNLKIVLMAVLMAQPVYAMDQDPSSVSLWSFAKSHPVLTAGTGLAFATTAAVVGYFGTEVWTMRQNRIRRERSNKLYKLVSTSKDSNEIQGVIVETQSESYLHSQLNETLSNRLMQAIRCGNGIDEANICLKASNDVKQLVLGPHLRSDVIWSIIDRDRHNIIELLMPHGITGTTLVSKSNVTYPLFFWAIAHNAERITEFLLKKNSALTALRSHDGVSPLHCAVQFGRDKLIQILLEHGADINARDVQNRTPLDLVSEKSPIDILPVLKHVDLEFDPITQAWVLPLLEFDPAKDAWLLPLAAKLGQGEAVQWLLEHGVASRAIDVGTQDFFTVRIGDVVERTPLALAAGNGHVSATQVLLAHRRKQLEDVKESLIPSLCCAAGDGHYFTVRVLIQESIDTRDTEVARLRILPLMAAIENSQHAVAGYLLDWLVAEGDFLLASESELLYTELPYDTEKLKRFYKCNTLVHMAVQRKFNEGFMLQLISCCTIDTLNALNDKGQTALDLACEYKNVTAQEMLLQAGAKTSQELKRI